MAVLDKDITFDLDNSGTRSWYKEVKGERILHRTDGPAIECANGTKYWYVEGKRHRTDGPAIEHADGTKHWYVEDKLHRTDGPAIECADGTKHWYIEDKRHRTDGPASEYANGNKYWYVEGQALSEKDFKKTQMKVVEPYNDPYDNYVFPKAEIKAEVEQAEKPERNVANVRNHLWHLWRKAWDESNISNCKAEWLKKRVWLNDLWDSAEDAYQTGSQVYGRFYRKDSSDKDVIVKVSRRDFASRLVSLIEKEQAKYYREGTCRVKIGDVDFIITTEQKIFDNWVSITDFLKHNPPPNKSETVKMFDMMEAGENYESYYRGQHRWFQHVEYMLGQFAEIGSHYCEVLGLYKMGYGTYCVLRHVPPDKEFRVMDGAAISSLRGYFGGKLEAGQHYAIVPITEIKKCVPKITTKIKEEKMNEESYSMDAPNEERTYKDALKASGHKMKDHIKHGMAVGAATEGASYAYQQVAHVLKTQFGVSDEALNDPLKRELITFAALAVTHMGATVFDEVPGMDKVTKGCELAIEGKAKDNTGALIQHLLPMLLNVSKAMDPSTHMQRIAAEAEKQRVALDNAEQDAHTEAAALEEDHNEPAKAR